MDESIGRWAFIIGIIVAIIAGLVPNLQASNTVTWILVIAGLVVGLLNVTARETTEFLVATITLIIVGSTGLTVALGTYIGAILTNIVAIAVPAGLVVALKAVYALARS